MYDPCASLRVRTSTPGVSAADRLQKKSGRRVGTTVRALECLSTSPFPLPHDRLPLLVVRGVSRLYVRIPDLGVYDLPVQRNTPGGDDSQLMVFDVRE